MTTAVTTTCRCCTHPVTAVGSLCYKPFQHEGCTVLCDFHLDWEFACDVVEVECGGSTPGSYVRFKMREMGWTDEQIDERRKRESV